MKSWSRLDWLIVIIFAALVALFYWRILTPNLADRQSFPPGDFSAQFWAFATFEARELSAGRLPLWNPYTFAGSPFWADVQAAVFYPPSLLTLLLSGWAGGFSLFALEVEAIVHLWLAAVFMYLFVRDITHSRAAGVIAALTFTFSGYLTGYPSQQLAVLETAVWLPLILFFLHRAGQQMANRQIANKERETPFLSIFWFLLAGAAWGMALLAGHPQSALIVGYVSAAYGYFQVASSRVTGSNTHYAIRNTFYSLLCFLLTGLGLAAVQFIPAMEYTLLSVRAAGTYDKMSGGFPLTDLIQLLLPGQVSLYSPLYVGVVSLILAVWVTLARPTRHTTFWTLVAGVSLLISFGGNTFFYSPLYLVAPGFAIFRGQERWALAAAFSLAVLAGYGFKACQVSGIKYQVASSRITDNDTQYAIRNMPYVLRFTFYLLLFSLLLTFLFFFGLNDTGWQPDSPFYKLLGGASLLTLLLGLTWLLWRAAHRLPPAIFTGLTAALVCFDLFTANWQTNLYPQPPEWHTQMPAVVSAIKADATDGAPFRVYNEFRLYDNYGVPFALEDLWGASPLRPDRYDKFLAPPMPIERTWELLNVSYVITWRKELFAPSTIIYQEPAADGVTYVHRLNQVGPRVWLVSQFEITDDATILKKLADPTFDRWHIALLEPGSSEAATQQIGQSTINIISHVSRITYHSPSSFSVQVNTPTPALLILSETYYPGWQAAVDNQPASLLRADYILRAVPVSPGEHTVTLTFRPLSFTIGAIISGLTLLGVSAALVLLRPKDKR